MRATDYTTARCNLRSALEITRSDVRCRRRTAVIALVGAATLGFAAAMLCIVVFNLCQLGATP